MHSSVTVDLGARSYDIIIEQGILERLPDIVGDVPIAVIGDARLRDVLDRITATLRAAGRHVATIPVVADEDLKSLRAIEPIYGLLLGAGIDRRGAIIGVGGGTIGDAIGFVAATYLRGIQFISVPTTLLAAVDSAVGGKTGLNHPLGKNLIGVVAQPSLVAIDPLLFTSLDMRDRVSGLGEILKYALMADPELYDMLERDPERVLELRDMDDIIRRCLAIKADLVTDDEFDRKGIRELLNFGHTLAHALERTIGYGSIRHGEAVIVGMRAECALSVDRGHLDPGVAQRIDTFLATLPVEADWRHCSIDDIVEATSFDKKRGPHGEVRFVLLQAIGSAVSDDDVHPRAIRDALRAAGFAGP